MEKEIFKVGDRVFSLDNGWGTVKLIARNYKYPVDVLFDNDATPDYTPNDFVSFTLDGREYLDEDKVLSFTEYSMIQKGFSQERPIAKKIKDFEYYVKQLDGSRISDINIAYKTFSTIVKDNDASKIDCNCIYILLSLADTAIDEMAYCGMDEVKKSMVDIHTKKNHDYGDSFGKSMDEDGLLVAKIRIGDKVNRYNTLLKGEQKLNEESINDTLLDMANYSLMTAEWLENRK